MRCKDLGILPKVFILGALPILGVLTVFRVHITIFHEVTGIPKFMKVSKII